MVFRERPGRDDSGRCGHHSAEEIPVPIPNTEVKLRDGDDSRKAKITNGHSDSRFPYGRRLFSFMDLACEVHPWISET